MKISSLSSVLAFAAICQAAPCLQGAPLDAAVQKKVEAMVANIKDWAADPTIVKAVREQNAKPSAEVAGMSQDKWKAATVLDPFVRALTKSEAGAFLKSKKTDAVSEAFVSDANGLKVSFLAKTSSWSHKGKPKHDKPMEGATWQGEVEVDESTGLQQVQVSVPVLDGGKPIGSLVVGLAIAKLGE